MNIPKRWCRSRGRGTKQPPNTKYVGRPTIYGNPFKAGETGTFYHGIQYYEKKDIVCIFSQELDVLIVHMGMTEEEFFEPLLKYDYLSCFCSFDEPCHVDVLIERLEQYVAHKTTFHQVPMHFPPTFIPKPRKQRARVAA